MAGAGGGALLTRTRPLLSASQPGPRANSRWVSCLLPPSPPACTAIASYLASATPHSFPSPSPPPYAPIHAPSSHPRPSKGSSVLGDEVEKQRVEWESELAWK